MLRLHKNQNVLITLRNRECGLVTSPIKLVLNAIFHLVKSKNRLYRRMWEHACDKRICYEDGKLYLHNYSDCLSMLHNEPISLYFIDNTLSVVDALLCTGRSLSSNPGPLLLDNPSTYRGFFLTLRDNWLQSYDYTTGVLLQKIYLGTICRFKHCSWETVCDTIYVSSEVKGLRFDSSINDGPHVFATLAIFTLFPIEFKAMLQITDDIFREDIKKFSLESGIFIIAAGTINNSFVYLYDLSSAINSGIEYTAKLNKPCSHFSNNIVGLFNAGLPINCKLKGLPPMLFKVRCNDYTVCFGGFPWHYMVLEPRQSYYQVYRLSDSVPAVNGMLPQSDSRFENENAYFHFDSSERIIFERGDEVQVHAVSQSSANSLPTMTHLFSMNFSISPLKTKAEDRSTSRTLRKCTPKTYVSVFKNVLCIDYEDQLDMISILGFDPTDVNCDGLVRFYDNFTGSLIRTINLDLRLDEVDKYGLSFNLDTLVIIEGKSMGKYLCYVYKLISFDYMAPKKKKTIVLHH